MKPSTYIAKHTPCSEGAAFAMRFQTMREVWDSCPRAGWLCSIVARLPRETVQTIDLRRLFARVSGLTARNAAETAYVELIREIIPNPFK